MLISNSFSSFVLSDSDPDKNSSIMIFFRLSFLLIPNGSQKDLVTCIYELIITFYEYLASQNFFLAHVLEALKVKSMDNLKCYLISITNSDRWKSDII